MNPADKTLRSQLIRLAHSNPDLRKELLPLLVKKSDKQKRAKAELVTVSNGPGKVYLDADDPDALFDDLKSLGIRGSMQGDRVVVSLGMSVNYNTVIGALQEANYLVDA